MRPALRVRCVGRPAHSRERSVEQTLLVNSTAKHILAFESGITGAGQGEEPDVSTTRPKRILIGKVGLDGHDRGAKFMVRALRNAGYEVIYTGIRRTPEQIVRTAVDEDVDVIGLSLLSGAHKELFARVAELLKEEDADNIILLAGGTIPQKDIPRLKSLGFRRVFTPGASLSEILSALEEELAGRPAAGGGANA